MVVMEILKILLIIFGVGRGAMVSLCSTSVSGYVGEGGDNNGDMVTPNFVILMMS